jgi:uncharacterized protein YutE (UPF0331/DUF86 family)
MVDPVRLKGLLDRVAAETADLRRSSGASLEDLQPDLIAAVKYRFVVAIEAAIDASRHVAASRGLRMATDYADAFVVLGEAAVLDAELVRELKDMAGFRNLLVHGYAVVDDARVVEILQTRLGDFDDFRRQIAKVVTD